jgi:hypothetical protein
LKPADKWQFFALAAVIDRAATREMNLRLCARFYRKGMVRTWERF